MDPLTLTIFVLLSAASAGVGVWSVIRLATVPAEARLRQRLRDGIVAVEEEPAAHTRLATWIRSIGERFAAPFMSEKSVERQKLRAELVKAGIYSADAAKLVVAARVALLFGGVLAGLLVAMMLDQRPLLGASAGGVIGYLMPKLWLRSRIRRNQRELERALPDALDLMVVCVEAGLTLDAAMQRVAEELGLVHPALAREMTICHMETRIGLPRSEALRNLGTRSDFAPLQAVTAMLVQAERFGTSIATALRIQAEGLRVKRQHMAEEAAAKASVKLSFPLVLFIFPATFIILAGPSVLRLLESSIFN